MGRGCGGGGGGGRGGGAVSVDMKGGKEIVREDN